MTIIGIDLGTTNSCVAVMDGGDVRVIESPEGNRTTPSVVAFKAGEVLVGRGAKRQAVTNPANTLFAVKRLIGRKYDDSVVRRDMAMVPYEIVEAHNGDAWVVGDGEPLAPPQVSAEVLKKLKRTAEESLGEAVDGAVITVPAYFDYAQRQATRDAGRIAGLDVKRIVSEPTAAALAYGMTENRSDSKVAVFDLGGGTFDISIIEFAMVDGTRQLRVLSTNGDTFLGGEDFDLRLIDHLVSQFERDSGINVRNDPLALQRLKEAAEMAKIDLSSRWQTEIHLPYISADNTGPKHLITTITRGGFERLVEDLVGRAMGPCRDALADAHLKVRDIDDVILVGNQARTPLVQRRVGSFFGREPRCFPDEDVAIGAAIQAAVLAGNMAGVELFDVVPLSLGIETLGGAMHMLIEKNTPLPAATQQVYSPSDGSHPTVALHVLQGENKHASGNRSLGRVDVTAITPASGKGPQVEMSLQVDIDGIVSVSVKDEATRENQSFVIEPPTGLTEDDIQRMIDDAEAHGQKEERFDPADNTGGSALEEFVKDLAPAVDAFERAAFEVAGHAKVASGSARAAMASMEKGIALSLKVLQGVMKQHGIDLDDPTGRPYDSNLHEAMMMVSDPNVPSGSIVEVFEKGYTVKGRLVRPAKVSVASR